MKILLEVMKCRAVFVCAYLCVCVCQEALCVFVVEGCKSLKILSVFTTLMLVYVEGTEQGFGEMTQSTEVQVTCPFGWLSPKFLSLLSSCRQLHQLAWDLSKFAYV